MPFDWERQPAGKPIRHVSKPQTLFSTPTLYSCTSGTAREPLVTVARAWRSGFLLPPAAVRTNLRFAAAVMIHLIADS